MALDTVSDKRGWKCSGRGAAGEDVDLADEGTSSVRRLKRKGARLESEGAVTGQRRLEKVQLTADRHHEIFGVDADRLRLEKQSFIGGVDLRVSTLDRAESSFSTKSLEER